jgi:CRP-like cAMP-binding protein
MFDDPVVVAFLFGGLSALSLPVGAALGIWLRPSMRVTGAVMAFGAGSLICALALELVVPAMGHFPESQLEGFKYLGLGALVGCLVFIGLDQVFSNMGAYLRKVSTCARKLKTLKRREYAELIQKLSQVELLLSLPPEDIRGIVRYVEKRLFPKGAVLMRQGDPGNSLYLIESGRVGVYARQPGETEEKTLAFMGQGETVGEMALMTGQPRVATVIAEEDVATWEIHKDDFDELVHTNSRLKARLEELVRERLNRRALAPVGTGKDDHGRTEMWVAAASRNLEREVGDPSSHEMAHAAIETRKGGGNVALAIWLGIALDGIPESLVIGSSMEGSAVSIALIGGLFMANLPESMSSAVVMRNQGDTRSKILWMWLSLMLLTAVGAALGNLFISDVPRETQAFLKGCAAGAMLAMVAQTMLPEAFEHGGWLTGLLTVVGFLAAIFMGTLDENQDKHQDKHEQAPAAQVSPVFPRGGPPGGTGH